MCVGVCLNFLVNCQVSLPPLLYFVSVLKGLEN